MDPVFAGVTPGFVNSLIVELSEVILPGASFAELEDPGTRRIDAPAAALG